AAVKREGLSLLDFDDAVQRLQRRVAAAAEWHPELSLPDVGTGAILSHADEWLPLYAAKASTAAELHKIPLCDVIWGMLGYEQQLAVDRIAPAAIRVPSGSSIRIDYRPGAEAPVLSVRLQECFGMTDTPRIDDGRRPLLMELLSPGFKPVQLTQDLASFWQNTYFEVRKELRRRYPKHYWPDNPLDAEAVRGTRRTK
ncbi:MAG: ATP-dependent helicase C-terminal domain-containing protein, partial [Muribaculaceae bacterium]